jgi:hypothetical protein
MRAKVVTEMEVMTMQIWPNKSEIASHPHTFTKL